MADPMLRITGLRTGYGSSEIVHDVSFELAHGQVLSIVGRNGVGKTTTLRAVAGQLPLFGGSKAMDGADVSRLKSFELSRKGLAFVPSDRQVFTDLTVRENLLLGRYAHRPGEWKEATILQRLFPRLQERYETKAGSLSGGEQQMLTIARALLSNPRVILLDEPTEGLAPAVVHLFVDAMKQISQAGVTIVLVEQNLSVPQQVASHHLVMENGEVVWTGDSDDLRNERERVEQFLLI